MYNIIKLVVHVPVTDFSLLHIFKEGQLPEVLDSLNPSNRTPVKIKHLCLLHPKSHF